MARATLWVRLTGCSEHGGAGAIFLWFGGRRSRRGGLFRSCGGLRCLLFFGLRAVGFAAIIGFPKAVTFKEDGAAAAEHAGDFGFLALRADGQGISLDRLEMLDNAAFRAGVFVGRHSRGVPIRGCADGRRNLASPARGTMHGGNDQHGMDGMNRAFSLLQIAVVGTDTAIGKTAVTTLVVQGLRAVSRLVRVHTAGGVRRLGWEYRR